MARQYVDRICRDCQKPLAYRNVNVRCHKCSQHHRKASTKPVLPIVPGNYMQPGRGERLDTCVDYDRCLTTFANRSGSQGHCPRNCVGYKHDPDAVHIDLTGAGFLYPDNGGL